MTAPGGAYYNEHDPVAAEWLRRLIKADLIAPGEVDERDIRDVTPAELSGFIQCHFFAGIGIWSGALRAAGVPDDRPWWTGSCPCQPFSAAGRGDGVDDERHLWPHWFWLISECRPGVVTGEQVAGKDGLGWNDLVSADLDGAGYAFGSINLCAAGFGLEWGRSAYAEWLERALYDCPDPLVARQIRNFASWARQSLTVGGLHIRQRQYFIGLADEPSGGWRERRNAALARASGHADSGGGPSGGLSDAEGSGGGTGLCDRGPAEQRGPVATDLGPDDELARSGGLHDSSGPRCDPEGRGLAGEIESDGGVGGSVPGVGRPDGGLVNGERPRLERLGGDGDRGGQPGRLGEIEARSVAAAGESGGLADNGRGGFQSGDGPERERGTAERNAGAPQERQRGGPDDTAGGPSGGLVDSDDGHAGERSLQRHDQHGLGAQDGGVAGGRDRGPRAQFDRGPAARETDGGRSPFDWLLCRDGVWRAAEPVPQSIYHAIADIVGPVGPAIQAAVEEEIDARWPAPRGATLLRGLLETVAEKAMAEREQIRKSRTVWEAAVLLAFVQQLATQGWHLANEVSSSSPEVFEAAMRSLRQEGLPDSPPCGSGPDEQRPIEHSDSLPELSRILAQGAKEAWGEVVDTYAETGLPITVQTFNRVGRLRAYGNGLDFETAKAFCQVAVQLADEADL